ncbi:MAG TPA: glycosyltransferase family 4 protein [Rubricoccaceae bacterium]|nr:glycosyltransferase family 4 protein [Rubricoccaceae bacterium]
MKVAIVVHGRFHAFDLARAVLARGHDVVLFTNYPRRVVARFGFPPERVHSFVLHGVLARVLHRLRLHRTPPFEAGVHRLFGRWAAARLRREHWDRLHVWSGVAEETFRASLPGAPLKTLMRGSAHVRTQARLLEEEERRVGTPLDRPSAWMIGREEREYALSERILVLSSFARRTFMEEGEPAEKVRVYPLAARLDQFHASAEVVEARRARIRSGAPLRVLYVGALSFQKGLRDLLDMARCLPGDRFIFRCVGPLAPEVREAVAQRPPSVELVGKRPQHQLPAEYAWGDVFVFPTLQDGFAVVLAQAQASGLPILTTPNGAGPDIIREGKTGWILPVRSPSRFAERLRWCDAHREALAEMVAKTYEVFRPLTWDEVAIHFEQGCAPRPSEQPAQLQEA